MKNARILIVEDEALVATDLEEQLTRLGYAIVGVTDNGEEAVRTARERPVDLVLMDIQIAGALDGIQTAGRLLDEFHLPVVFLTGHADPRTLQRAGATAPYGYVTKPYDERALHATLEMAFCRIKSEQRIRQIGDWLTAVLFNVNDPIVAVNCQGEVLFMNPAAESLTGWSFVQAQGRSSSDVLRLVDRRSGEPITSPLGMARLAPRTVTPEDDIELLTRSGSRLQVEFAATPLQVAPDSVIGAVVVLNDVTRQKAVERELRATNRSLEETNRRLQALNDALSRPPGTLLDG